VTVLFTLLLDEGPSEVLRLNPMASSAPAEGFARLGGLEIFEGAIGWWLSGGYREQKTEKRFTVLKNSSWR
jgi:hypothetical protein